MRQWLRHLHPILLSVLLIEGRARHRDLHSFPTRRSSDLSSDTEGVYWAVRGLLSQTSGLPADRNEEFHPDRKSTRLNSSHSQISYAVFCLKKKRPSPDVRTSILAVATRAARTRTRLSLWE